MKVNWRLILTVILIIGMLDSAFLVYEHYSPTASEFCSFGENIDCGIVNKSAYATLDGIFYLLVIDWGWNIPFFQPSSWHPIFEFLLSNAVLGFITLGIIIALLQVHKTGKDVWFIENKNIPNWIVGILGFGIIYGGYLVFIQHSILKTWCPFCLLLDVIMILALISAIFYRGGNK